MAARLAAPDSTSMSTGMARSQLLASTNCGPADPAAIPCMQAESHHGRTASDVRCGQAAAFRLGKRPSPARRSVRPTAPPLLQRRRSYQPITIRQNDTSSDQSRGPHKDEMAFAAAKSARKRPSCSFCRIRPRSDAYQNRDPKVHPQKPGLSAARAIADAKFDPM